MSTFEFYDSKLGYYNYIVDGIKAYPSYNNFYKKNSKRKEEKGFTFIPYGLIKCPYCKKSNHYNLEDFKEKHFIKKDQSRIYYICKYCGKEVNI